MKKRVSRFNDKYLIDNREVRFFLSSTFADMEQERSAIVNVFNELKIEARKRDVLLTIVDLRWGVTKEESKTGRVLSVCLNEIEHSHPFFIGLLGSRYGSSPDLNELKKNPELEERYPWLRKDLSDELSVTEIEIQYGVLRNPNPVNAAFFFNKTPGCLPDSHERLTSLKNEIHNRTGITDDDYHSIEELRILVRKRVLDILDNCFSVSDHTRLFQEQTAQLAYINSYHSHYVKRSSNHRMIDGFINGQQQFLVVSGPSGIGKSALIANWIKDHHDKIPYHIIYYFVGNASTENDYHHILSYIHDNVDMLCPIEHPHFHEENMVARTQRLITEAAQKNIQLLIVIDGINQIPDSDNAKLLNWLPATENKNIKFLFSTTENDETWNTFRRRDYPICKIMPLTKSQRKSFAKQYLSFVGKKLDDGQLERILSNEQCKNTLVLKTLLDELICFGSFKHLNKRIKYYLAASSPIGFFNRMLKRLEADYSLDQDIVRHVLSLISLSENGLGEEEILRITGIRPIDWHLFYCAFYNHLMAKEGLVSFSHQYITDAVWKRYKLGEKSAAEVYRKKIASYFSSADIGAETRHRQLSELSFQYYHLHDCERLYQTIFSLEAFNHFCNSNLTQLADYWHLLQAENPDRYSFHNYLLLPSENTKAEEMPFLNVGLFSDLYFADYQFSIKCFLTNIEKTVGTLGTSHPHIAAAYNNIGDDYAKLSDAKHALEYYEKALALTEKPFGTHHPDTCIVYNNIGAVYADLADYKTALEYYEKALNGHRMIWGETHPVIAVDYNNMGSVYFEQGLYGKAISYFDKARTISESKQGTSHPDTALYLNNLGKSHLQQQELDKAKEYCSQALAIRLLVFGVMHPETASSILDVGLIHYEQDQFETARKLFATAKTICERTLGKEHPDTAEAYYDLGLAYHSLNKDKTAFRYYSLALSIRKEKLGEMHPLTAFSYNSIGVLYATLGKFPQALDYLFKSLNIREKVLGSKHVDTGFSYLKIGSVFNLMGEYRTAADYYAKALVTYEENGDYQTNEVQDRLKNILALF